jgi:hypothetical protein
MLAGCAGSRDPDQADHTTPNDKVWKRIQGSSMMTIGYLGIL